MRVARSSAKLPDRLLNSIRCLARNSSRARQTVPDIVSNGIGASPGAAEVYRFLRDCDSLIPTPLAAKDLASVMRQVIRIERVNSAEQESGEPLLTQKGYKMAGPGGGPDRSR